MLVTQLAACSLGLSATTQQYFSLGTNQPPASSTLLSEQISTSHQSPANRTGCRLLPAEGSTSPYSVSVLGAHNNPKNMEAGRPGFTIL
jgi:hypothetical protein